MKKKALATKMAAFVMAGAMTMAMGFPALADQNLEVPLNKTVTVAENTFAPNTTFTFTIESKGKTDADTTWDDAVDAAGPANGLIFQNGSTEYNGTAGLKFTPAGNAPAASYTEQMKVKISTDKFTKPGRYHYVVKEQEGNYEGVTYTGAAAANAKEVIVYVLEKADGTLEYYMSGKILETSDVTGKDGKLASIDFTNEYGKTDDDNSKVKDLKIKKTISGSFASAKDVFDISVEVDQQTENGPENDDKEQYYVVVACNHNDSKAKNDVLTSGTAKTFSVHGNDTITVYGLSAHDTFYVKETKDEGYTPSYTFNQKENWTANSEGYYSGNILTGENSGAAEVTINNDKEAATPTGIVTEYAPYILLVAAAGAFAVLFLRRKKEEF